MMRDSNPAWLALLALSPMVAAQPAVEAAPVVDIFAVRTWEPPPAPAAPAAPVAPPAPQAPPLPFQYLGRIVDAERGPSYLLDDGSRVLVVGVGDLIGKNYRLEKHENGKLLFRYRPMNVRQALDVGEKK